MLTKKNLIFSLVWLALVVSAYFTGAFVWQWFEPAVAQKKAQRQFQPVVATPAGKKLPRAATEGVRPITSANLFGNDRQVKKSTATSKVVDAPETRLKFVLQGIFVSSIGKETRALIAEKGKPARTYKKDDELPGNVVVEDILDDHVLLRRAGRLETLSFPEKRTNNTGKKPKQLLTFHPEATTAQQAVKNSKDSFYQNPAKAFGQYGLSIDDEAGGLRLGGGANSRVLQRVGLKQGDLLRSVNGKTLSDFMADDNLVDDVVASGELTVEIERGGQPIMLSLPIP